MTGFTGLERSVIDITCDGLGESGPRLRALLETAQVRERDNTGHGFYTYFDVDRRGPRLNWPDRMVNGPNLDVKVGDQVLWMGFIIWLDAGYPDCMEGFQYATTTGGSIDLKFEDLGALEMLGPMSLKAQGD